MSLEDLCALSDESDCEAEKDPSTADSDDEEFIFLELLCLHNALKRFEFIHFNNSIMDMQDTGNELVRSFDSDSGDSEFSLLQSYIDSLLEDLFTPDSSPTPSTTARGDGPSSDWDEPARSVAEAEAEAIVQLYEEEIAATSSSSSSSSDLWEVD